MIRNDTNIDFLSSFVNNFYSDYEFFNSFFLGTNAKKQRNIERRMQDNYITHVSKSASPRKA
jgi:hypothetical protein